MKVIIEMTHDEARRLEPLARRLFDDSEDSASRRYGSAYIARGWNECSDDLRRHWLRHAAVQEYVD